MSAAGRGAERRQTRRADDRRLPRSSPCQPRLVAREAESTAITSALAAASAGQSGVALLTGEPGIGKTRLAQEASVYAAERGFMVVSGRHADEQQRETPFVPLFEARRPPARQLRLRYAMDWWIAGLRS